VAAPARTQLLAPAPNPARDGREVSFALATAGDVDLAVFAADGRRVRTLAHGAFPAGTYRFTWEGDDGVHRAVPPGIYFAQLVTGGRRFSRTLVQLR
jgi:flagellar hook assembly protein FlgD